LGFGVWGLGFGVWGLGFGVWGLGFGVWGLGFGVWGLEFAFYLLGMIGRPLYTRSYSPDLSFLTNRDRTCSVSRDACARNRGTRHALHVTRHTSHVTRHTSPCSSCPRSLSCASAAYQAPESNRHKNTLQHHHAQIVTKTHCGKIALKLSQKHSAGSCNQCAPPQSCRFARARCGR